MIQLSVGDGFKFGCGVILAVLAFSFSVVILGTVALLVATMLNIPLPWFMPPRG